MGMGSHEVQLGEYLEEDYIVRFDKKEGAKH
jgi:hypothetical protein